VAGIAVGVVLVAGGGAAYAATQLGDDGLGDPEAILSDVAARLGVTPDDLRSAIDDEARERLDDAVASGQLTEDQAASIEDHLESGSGALIEPPGDPGAAFGGPFDGGGYGGSLDTMIQTAADYIGISTGELVSEVQGGATPAEVAEAHGKTAAGLEDALVAVAGEEARDQIHRVITEGLSDPSGFVD
jgi:hypothetical protein